MLMCMLMVAERHTDDGTRLKFEEEQDYWEGSGEDLDMHGDDDEADMRTQEELMMQHRYMMVGYVCLKGLFSTSLGTAWGNICDCTQILMQLQDTMPYSSRLPALPI